MTAQALNSAQAFSAGQTLWVTTNDLTSPLNQKMDWYLNFQLTQARRHKSKEVSPQIKTILTDNPLPQFANSTEDDSSLLILSNGQLPCEFLLVVSQMGKQQDPKKWAQTVLDHWQKFKKPSLRVFLPKSMTAAAFTSAVGASNASEMTVVTSA